MAEVITKERTGQMLKAALAVLDEAGTGLRAQDVMQGVENKLQFSEHERARTSAGGVRWRNLVQWSSDDMSKAGWIDKRDGLWNLTASGKDAMQMAPGDLVTEAARKYAQWLKAEDVRKKAEEAEEKGSVDPQLIPAEKLAAALLWDEARAQKLAALALRSNQLLFYGPPGTGKTFVAKALARLLSGDEVGQTEIVQFHPSYAYEDFIEGIRPVLGDADAVSYELREGVMRRLIAQAIESPKSQFFLIVDEINRANLPRVFGELLYGLEYRGPGNEVTLPYSQEKVYVPLNLKLIGTMNTADKSIALVDAALRRRFRHVEFAPDMVVLERYLKQHSQGKIASEAVARLSRLNQVLESLLDRDRLIGQTYLMRPDLDEVGFETVWIEDLEPVLREHLFNRPQGLGGLKDSFLSPL